jgi:hypothetical protein
VLGRRAGDLVVGELELVDESPEAERDLDRVEVLALKVLDEGDLEAGPLVELADDGRDPLEPGRGRRPKPALPGDELVAVEGLHHEDRLEDAVRAHARGERGELRFAESPSRLIRVVADAVERDLVRSVRAGRALWDERGQAATEALRSIRTDGHESTMAAWSGSATPDGGFEARTDRRRARNSVASSE